MIKKISIGLMMMALMIFCFCHPTGIKGGGYSVALREAGSDH